MNTVNIYKIVCTQSTMAADQGTGFSLRPWGTDTDTIKGFDDGGQEYILPDGYSVAESRSKTPEIYNDDDKHCELVVHEPSGKPQIAGISRKMPVLILLEDEFTTKEIMLFSNNLEWYLVTNTDGDCDLKHQTELSSILECGEDPEQFGYVDIERCWNHEDYRDA